MGKQRLSSMFTSSVFKKNERTKGSGLSTDSIVDDVLAEFAPDEKDREEWRRRGSFSRMLGPRGSFTPVQNSNELSLNPANQMNAIDSSDAKLETVSMKSGLLENDISDYGKDDPMEIVTEEEVMDPNYDSKSKGNVTEMKDANEEIEVEAAKNENGFSVNAKNKRSHSMIDLRALVRQGTLKDRSPEHPTEPLWFPGGTQSKYDLASVCSTNTPSGKKTNCVTCSSRNSQHPVGAIPFKYLCSLLKNH